MPPLYIIAGNNEEYLKWRRTRTGNSVYVYSPDALLGCRNISGYFIGSYRKRDDLDDILFKLDIVNNKPYGYYKDHIL